MSFRQFGGLQYAARNNIVSSNYNTNSNLQVTGNVGQPNSYINFQSDISGNIIVNGDFDLSGNLNVKGNELIEGNNNFRVIGDGVFEETKGGGSRKKYFKRKTNKHKYHKNKTHKKKYKKYHKNKTHKKYKYTSKHTSLHK